MLRRLFKKATNFRSSRGLASKSSATLLDNVHRFAEDTTLHGCKFIGDKNLSFFERTFFLISFVISLVVCIYFTMNIYTKWTSTPVIIARSASSTYISEIPFPAITVCNMNQALKSKVSQLSRNSTRFALMLMLCNREDRVQNTNFTRTWTEYEAFIAEMTQGCSEMLVLCRYGSFTFNCTSYIRPVLTNEGRCCSFNVVDPSFMYVKHRPSSFSEFKMPDNLFAVDWTPEGGYPDKIPKWHYPVEGFGTGYEMGLTLILDANINEYHCSSTNGPGFKVRLHAPTETPNVGDSGFPLPLGFETRAVIIPQLSDASENIRSMRKEVRNCAFSNEMNLTYFRTYSRRSCEMECEAFLVAEECKCLLYYMPRVIPDAPLCGVKEMECFKSVIIQAQTANQDSNNCSVQCMSSCFDLTYGVLTYSSPISPQTSLVREKIIQNMTPGYAEENIAVVHFYYIDNAFRSNTKEQFVGFTDFLSSIGGLLGLFIGFSFISLVEVFYYATFRPCCAYHQKIRQSRKAASTNYLKPTQTGRLMLYSDKHIHAEYNKPLRGARNEARKIIDYK